MLARAVAFVGEHSLSILLFNFLLRKIYFLLLFRVEYPGVNFHAVDMQSTLRWWDCLGCTVFMVAVPVGCILLKTKIKSMAEPVR